MIVKWPFNFQTDLTLVSLCILELINLILLLAVLVGFCISECGYIVFFMDGYVPKYICGYINFDLYFLTFNFLIFGF